MYLYRPGSDSKTNKNKVSSVQGVYQEFDEHFELLTQRSDKIRKQMGKQRAEGGGCENWMCSKACGQVVSRARTCGSRGITSRITSRDSPRPGAVASSLSILPYFVTLLPRRSELCLCRCHDYHRVEEGGAYTKVSDLARSFFFATTCPPTRWREIRGARTLCKGIAVIRMRHEFTPPKRLLFIVALFSAIHACVCCFNCKTLFIPTGNVRRIRWCLWNFENILKVLWFEFYNGLMRHVIR